MNFVGMLAVAPLIGLITACGATVTSTSDSPPPPPSTTESTSPSDPSADSTSAANPDLGVTPLGGTATLSSGVAVSISEPKKFKASDSAAGTINGGNDMQFTVTIVNDGTEKYDPALFSMSAAGGPDGAPCSTVIDFGGGIEGAPSTTVLPGKRTTFPYAISCPATVKSGDELIIDAFVDMLGENPIFVGSAP